MIIPIKFTSPWMGNIWYGTPILHTERFDHVYNVLSNEMGGKMRLNIDSGHWIDAPDSVIV